MEIEFDFSKLKIYYRTQLTHVHIFIHNSKDSDFCVGNCNIYMQEW